MDVALATCSALAGGYDEDLLLAAALREHGAWPEIAVWDDPAVDWAAFDTVVIRSTWDYTQRRDDFLAWADSVGERLRNAPAVVRWNSDKSYLADLRAAGVPIVDTVFVGPVDPDPPFPEEVVVKPAVSAGARDTGRFGPGAHPQARALLARLRSEGRTAMVQPYLSSVDEQGETALVYVDGEFSHALRKRAVLAPDEEAPIRDDALGAAEMMWQDDLVEAGEARATEFALGEQVLGFMRERFGGSQLFLRVDLVTGAEGNAVVMELEAVEPSLYFGTTPGSSGRLAAAIMRAGP